MVPSRQWLPCSSFIILDLEIYHTPTLENTVHNFSCQSRERFLNNRAVKSLVCFFSTFAKNNNDLYCYAVSSRFSHLCSTCKRASYPIDDYLLHNFKIMKPPRTHMQNPDGFWEAWGTQSHVTRVTYRPGGRSYLMFTFLRKKWLRDFRSAADFNAKCESCARTAIDVIS